MKISTVTDAEREELAQLLEALPAPLEPLDIVALDGFLVGVLLQPQGVPAERWLAHVHDVDGRAAPPAVPLQRLQQLALRRHAELQAAIGARRWFDPWIYELDDPDASPSDAVLPWVAGFATAMTLFPGLMQLPGAQTLEPLAALYVHLDPDDLEDADELLAEIEAFEPPADLAEAVDDVVRSTLRLADAARPRAATKAGPLRHGPGRGPRR